MSVSHSHRDWLMPLFAVRKLRKIDLVVKNKRVSFHSVIFLFGVKVLMTNQQVQKILLKKNTHQKNAQCVKAFKGKEMDMSDPRN